MSTKDIFLQIKNEKICKKLAKIYDKSEIKKQRVARKLIKIMMKKKG